MPANPITTGEWQPMSANEIANKWVATSSSCGCDAHSLSRAYLVAITYGREQAEAANKLFDEGLKLCDRVDALRDAISVAKTILLTVDGLPAFVLPQIDAALAKVPQ